VEAVSTATVLAAQARLAGVDSAAERWRAMESAGYPYDYGYYDYGYPDYAYDDSYYDNGSCYVVQRRVHSRSGWHVRPVQVCS